MKFTKEIKDKWLENLKSGEFKKTTGYLEHEGKYCCLGVLAVSCDLEINSNGTNLENNTDYFESLGLDVDVAHTLTNLNDVKYKNDGNFDNMIPHIETLKTE